MSSSKPNTFAALRHSDFRLLWTGLAMTGIGDSMQQFGLGWLVVQLAVADGVPHLAPLYIGLVGLSRGVPGLLFGVLGGVLADRADRRLLLIVMRGAGFLVAAALAALAIAGVINLAWVMILSAISSITFAVDQPARQAILPNLVPEEDFFSAVGLSQATVNVAMILGPLLGGLLITPIGVAGILAVDALAYVAAAAALLGMNPLARREAVRHTSVLWSLVDGLRFVWRDPVLRSVVGLSSILSLFVRPLQYLLPAVAIDTLGVGAVELSWLLAAASIGTLLGSLGAASVGGIRRQGVVAAAAVAFAGVAQLAFAAQTTLVPALLFVVLPGIGHFGFSGIAFGLMQTRTPDRLRGRVIGIYVTTIGGINPLGNLVMGGLGAAIGVSGSIGWSGILCAVGATLVFLCVTPLRLLGTHRATAPSL